MPNDFERDLRKLDDMPNFQKALTEVCDTAFMCRQFLNTFVGESKFTAADIIALTALVIAAERRIEAADSADLKPGPVSC